MCTHTRRVHASVCVWALARQPRDVLTLYAETERIFIAREKIEKLKKSDDEEQTVDSHAGMYSRDPHHPSFHTVALLSKVMANNYVAIRDDDGDVGDLTSAKCNNRHELSPGGWHAALGGQSLRMQVAIFEC